MRSTTGWQADSTTGTLRRAALERRELRPDDIAVRVDYCGVCHTDLHALQALESDTNGVLVPGHEFTGVVTEVGSAVSDLSRATPWPSATSSTRAARAACARPARRTSAVSSRH